MRQPAERAYHALSLALGRLLRSARYSTAVIGHENGVPQVRKRRSFYAPLLVWLGGPLMRFLDTGVRVLPQREWEERERLIYQGLHGASVRRGADRALVLPCLAGETLAALLENDALDESRRKQAMERAVAALADFHRRGFTHGDAMAENVLVDLDAGAAHWFDFETVHDSSRSVEWRRADDLRALLATCLVRIAPGERAGTLRRILDVYGDEPVVRRLAEAFTPVSWRPLTFHLGQAGLSLESYREISRLLKERLGE